MGSDKKAFDRIRVEGYKLVFLPWLTPQADETIQAYAARMCLPIKEDKPVLIGLSFGGMISIEIAKLIDTHKVILISSIHSKWQMPRWMRVAGKLKLNRLIPMRPYKILESIQNKRMGVTTIAEKELVNNYRKNTSQVYIDWAINQILNWNNEWQPAQLYHIHGDDDKIFPIQKLSPTHTVREAGHMMIFNRAAAVNECLKAITAD